MIFFLFACSTATFHAEDPYTGKPYQRYPSKPENYHVPIISPLGPQLDPSFYTVIGIVEASKEAVFRFENVSLNSVLDMLRVEARKAGADALIQVNYVRKTPSPGRRISPTTQDVDSISAQGVAIVFKNREEALKKLEEIKAIVN
jgi:hypothetical protein